MIEMDIVTAPSVCYAMSINNIPAVSDLRITNTEETEIIVSVTVTSDPPFISGKAEQVTLPGKDTANIPIDLIVDTEVLSRSGRRPSQVTVEIVSDGATVASRSFPIEILAYDEYPADAPYLISAFITPESPSVKGISPERIGYGDAQRTTSAAEDIYESIRGLGIRQTQMQDGVQRASIPDKTMKNREASASDVSILYASALEAAGLDPVMVFEDGRISSGAWLTDEHGTIPADDPSSVARKIADGSLFLIDPSSFSAGKSFSDARSSFKTDDEKFIAAVDVRTSRKTVTPTAMIQKDGIWVISQASVRQKTSGTVEKPTSKIEQWEKKLLDLTLRNSLINTRNTMKVMPLMSSDFQGLAEMFQGNRRIKILPRPQDWDGNKVYEERPFEPQQYVSNASQTVSDGLKKQELRTPLNETDTRKRLSSLFRESKRNMEESGSESLYMVLGMLKWFEQGSTAARYAPLIMVPMSMERSSDRYTLKEFDDEAMFNITLAEKLRTEHGVNIKNIDPVPFTDSGIMDAENVINNVSAAIKGKEGWEIVRTSAIGIFSFSQFVMWKDLRSFSGKLTENDLVRSLAESRLTWDAEKVTEDCDPYDLCLTLPADSSQIRAVKAAEKGKTFVLHGPPGTGKSQTITNIISNALYHGKTVLFVAEKMAALEVVEKRLKRIGIGEHCLELHSNKAQKSKVLEQLRDALAEAEKIDREEHGNLLSTVLKTRRSLKRYADALHEPQPSGMSIFDAISEYESIDPQGLYRIDIPKELIGPNDQGYFQNIDEILTKLSGLAMSVRFSDDVKCVGLSDLSKTDRMQSALDQLKEASEGYVKAWNVISSKGIFSEEPDAKTIQSTIDDLTSIGQGGGKASEAIERFRQSLNWAESLVREMASASPEKIAETASEWSGRLLRIRDEYQKVSETTDVHSLDNRVSTYERLARTLSSASGDIQDMRRLWKIPILNTKDLNKEWSEANSAGMFSKGKARKGFMDIVQGYLLDPSVTFETMPSALVPVNRVSESISDVRKAAEPADISKEMDALDQERKRSETAARLMERYGVDEKGLRSIQDKVSESSKELADLKSAAEQQDLAVADLTAMDIETPKDRARYLEFSTNLTSCKSEIWDRVNWNAICKTARTNGIGSAVDALENGKDPSKLRDSFFRSMYESIARNGIINSEDLATYNRLAFSLTVDQFKKFDAKFTELNKIVLKGRLYDSIQDTKSKFAKTTELRELNLIASKGSMRRSVRRLFADIPNILPKLFPCMLMSPLSVSQYFAPDASKFDIVIFDEASQIPIQKAVGALARGRSAVIVGDPKQLPPTSFFEARQDEDEEFAEEDGDSFLDECLAISIPDTYLKWHYRSRHESLIAFSNRTYYGNAMLTFPSPNDIEAKVSLRKIDGMYERGGGRTNRPEAQAVAEELRERLKTQKQSIGVVAFSKAQQDCIQDVFDEMTSKDQDLERAAYDRDEPVFIKNLETVQGDERDVILFSIGYGPDKSGKTSSNFGPLNNTGGQRRLNVAVSRSKEEMMVFSSMGPEDIKIRPDSPAGVKDLKDFLRFASNNGKFSSNDYAMHRPGIPESISAVLGKEGYRTHHDIGNSRFHVDIGVIDPDNSERYLLGILVDGETYKESENERDREFARNDVLKGLGWSLIRISSVDWFTHRDDVVRYLIDAIEKTRSK